MSPRLSPSGQRRVAATTAVLTEAFASRASTLACKLGRSDVAAFWTDPHARTPPPMSGSAEQFFAILARHEQRGDIDDPATLESWFLKAERQADPPREAGIEIMTMHRAKGLEFDTVVLLGLGRSRRGRTIRRRCTGWKERQPRRRRIVDGAADVAGDEDRLTRFVKRARTAARLAERARLLYVAATRARERLHLVCPASACQAHARGAHTAWPFVDGSRTRIRRRRAHRVAEPPAPQEFRTRAAAARRKHGAHAVAASRCDAGAAHRLWRPEFAWSSPTAVHIGTVVHRHLQRIADEGVSRWTSARVATERDSFRRELELLGVDPDDLPLAAERVTAALHERVGRFGGSMDADSAFGGALGAATQASRSASALSHIKLDRTFVEGNVRWIIDYKTGQHEGGDIDSFLASEVERYRPQLERYAAAMASVDLRAINLASVLPAATGISQLAGAERPRALETARQREPAAGRTHRAPRPSR